MNPERELTTIPTEVGKMLVTQYSSEMSNYFLYKNFANQFACSDIPQLEVYYNFRAEEEYEHANKIFNYLTTCDYEFTIEDIKLVKDNYDLIEAFEFTLEREIETTQSLYAIYEMAVECKDHATAHWLQQGLIDIQITDEEPESRTALGIIQEPTTSLYTKAQNILDLIKKNPYNVKKK